MEVFSLALYGLCKQHSSVYKLNTRDLLRSSLELTASHIVFCSSVQFVRHSCCGELRRIKLVNSIVLGPVSQVMMQEMDFKNVIYNAARDGKLRRLKVRNQNCVFEIRCMILYSVPSRDNPNWPIKSYTEKITKT
jgi:hypothetical protein